MWKQLFALARGRSYEATEEFVDRHALVVLRQQIRDCADAIAVARNAIGIAAAQNEEEVRQYRRLVSRLDDLEARALSALEQGRKDLAREAAEVIAMLEAERAASEEAQASFGGEIERLKRIVMASELRLRDLQRGQRIAAATDKTQRLRETSPGYALSALKDAEETLQRLRTRQKGIDVAAAAIMETEGNGDPAVLSARLAAAGCGPPLKTSADAVLQRLSLRMKASASTPKATEPDQASESKEPPHVD